MLVIWQVLIIARISDRSGQNCIHRDRRGRTRCRQAEVATARGIEVPGGHVSEVRAALDEDRAPVGRQRRCPRCAGSAVGIEHEPIRQRVDADELGDELQRLGGRVPVSVPDARHLIQVLLPFEHVVR